MTALAIGVGCRRGCPASVIVALVAVARGERAGPARLFTLADKHDEPGLREAATRLGLDLVLLPRAALAAEAPRIATRSAAAMARFGIPSVCEAAALAGAGPGARLVVPRLAAGGATCAIATLPEAP